MDEKWDKFFDKASAQAASGLDADFEQVVSVDNADALKAEKNVAHGNDDFAVVDTDIIKESRKERMKKTVDETRENINVVDADFDPDKSKENLPVSIIENHIEAEIEIGEDSREKELLAALEEARNHFAKTEYKDRTRMNTIRKALNMSMDGSDENPNIESARKPYEAALRDHMEYQIDKVQASGLEGKQLENKVKELYSFFNLQEATNYYDARTQAKMEYLKDDGDKGFAEKSWDFARLKSAQMSEWYSKKVPTSVKLGLALATFIPGASAFALGKRTWGAFMLVAAGGMQLDKLAQFKDAMADKHERNREFKNISIEEGRVDFDKLKDLLGGKIDNIDRKLNEKNLRSGANKFIAFAGALFLGSSVLKGAMDLADGKTAASTDLLRKLFAHKAEAPISAADSMAGPKLPKIPTSGVFADGGSQVTPLTDSMEHPNADVFVATKSLNIEKGSSIEKTLIDHIKKIHPDMKNPGAAAHRMWLDYMHDNKTEIIEKVGDNEYGKMLKDGMVNVKPGTVLMLDEHDPLKIKLHDISGKISHLNGHHPSVGNIVNHEILQPEDAPTPTEAIVTMLADAPKPEITSEVEMVAKVEEPQLSDDWINPSNKDLQQGYESLSKDYAKTIDNIVSKGDAATPDDFSELTPYDEARKELFARMGEIVDPQHLNPDNPAKQILGDIRRDMVGAEYLGKKEGLSAWKSMQFLRVSDVIGGKHQEVFDTLPSPARKVVKEFAKVLKPESAETFEKWTRRIVALTKK